jgi:hypothetical protein
MRRTNHVLSISGAVAICGLLSLAAVAQTATNSVSIPGYKDMATVLAALIAAIVAVTGWFIGHQLTTRRDDRTKRLQLTIAQSEKQISEFYAPLVFLLGQLDTIVSVRDQIDKDLGEIMYNEYFLPIHTEIIAILKTKIHLLEGGAIPPSLLTYIAHFTSENLAWRLNRENIQIWNFITGFPKEFPNELKQHQELVYKRYEDAVQELRHGVFAKS